MAETFKNNIDIRTPGEKRNIGWARWVTVIVTSGALVINICYMSMVSKSNKILARANELQYEQYITDSRPWLLIDTAEVYYAAGMNNYTIRLHNYGKTPAIFNSLMHCCNGHL